MKKLITATLLVLICSAAAFGQLLTPIEGCGPYGLGACTGATCTLHDTVSGGTWTSSNIAIVTVDPVTGEATGIATGSATITYTIAGGSYVTGDFYVTAPPAAITGAGAICVGDSLLLSDATIGGSWTSGWGPTTVNSITGEVYGASGGVGTINYVVGPGCYASTNVTVNAAHVSPIDTSSGSVFYMCTGSTNTLHDPTTGGIWSSSNTAVGTINPTTGVVTGISAGTTMISYTISGPCGSAYATLAITVSSTTTPGTITGPSTVYVGGPTITVGDAGGTWGGTWSSSDMSIARIGTSTGVVTGVAAGTVTLTYTVSGCGGIATTTRTETILNIDGIAGNVLFSGPHYGPVKVWLITYNATTLDLEAIDSMYATGSGTSYYYQFNGLPTDSFRVKAATNYDTSAMGYGSLPTYHDSSFYWHDANVINHISGTADINENIYMLYGPSITGPGFIGGNVTTGANRGTSGSIPSVGLKMYALNTASGTVAGMTRTDASGNYSFSSLPYGTYTIFPDSLNYATTPFTSITINASTPSMSAATFIQHTLSKTITPGSVGIQQVAAAGTYVTSFPNPTSGKLNMVWNEKTAEKGTISISDVTGREVYSNTINMNEGAGSTAIDLSGLNNGFYMINVKSASLNYNNKIEIQH